MSDPLPTKQADRVLFYGRVADLLDDEGTNLGFSPQEVQDARDDAEGADARLVSKENASAKAQAATAEFTTFDSGAESRTRNRLKRIKSHPNSTPALIETMGEAPREAPVSGGPPQTVPVGFAKMLRGRRQELTWADEMTPNSRRRPAGTDGVQIFQQIGGSPPLSTDGMKFIATDSATPYVFEFEPEDVGKTCYWKLRWYNKYGEGGDGETFSGTIGE